MIPLFALRQNQTTKEFYDLVAKSTLPVSGGGVYDIISSADGPYYIRDRSIIITPKSPYYLYQNTELANLFVNRTTPFTICFWIYITSYTNGHVFCTGANGTTGFSIFLQGNYLGLCLLGSLNYNLSSEAMTYPKWHFIEIYFEPTDTIVSVTPFIDGVKQLTDTHLQASMLHINTWLFFTWHWGPNIGGNFLNTSICDFTMLDGQWHNENYTTLPSSSILMKYGKIEEDKDKNYYGILKSS